jgi:hypothetical protein
MRVCGIEIRGSEAILAVVEAKAQSITHLPLETKKITLEDDDDSNHIKSFFSLIKDFVRVNHIDQIAIKKRGKKGEYAGGPTSFKIEGIIQLLDNCDVSLLSPQTISTANKKHDFDLPNSLNKYQREAFLTARAEITRPRK